VLTLGFCFQKKKSFGGFTLFLSSFFGSPSDNNNWPKRKKTLHPIVMLAGLKVKRLLLFSIVNKAVGIPHSSPLSL